MSRFVLAGDVGGTRARFALLDAESQKVEHHRVLDSRAFSSFEEALSAFLDPARARVGRKVSVAAATFGVAGPVVDQRVKTTNLPWELTAESISEAFGIPRVTLLNDLVAVGLGALAAPSRKLKSLQAGKPRKTGGNLAVIAAGTGLGEAAFVWDGAAHVPCATEGAHVDFAPRTPVESALLKSLTREFGHVSYERIASGSTIAALYTFFVREQRIPEAKLQASYVARAEDPNVAVVDLAESGKSEAAMRAVELWSSVYGAEAGNLALKSLATAGVFVCGGASMRLASVLAEGLPSRRREGKNEGPASPFLEAFLDKGRMRSLLERIPVAVCTDALAGLHGAAAHAVEKARRKAQSPRRSLSKTS